MSAQKSAPKVGKDSLASPQDTPLFVEDFNYTSGTLLNANGWSTHSGAGTNAIPVAASGLTFAGYPSSGVGNSASLTTTGEDVNRTFATQTTGSVYMAAMINVTASQTTGDYFLHFVDGPIAGNQFKARLFVKKDPATTNYAIGIQKSSTINTQYTGFTFAPGTTVLVVIKYTIVAGATNDTVTLFVNPTLGGAEPAPTLTATLGTDADATDIRGVALRQGTAANAATVIVDGIRIGTSWASVTATPTVNDANADFDGDGKTDFTAIRGTGSPFAGSSAGTIPAFKSNRERLRFQAQHPEMLLVPSGQTMYWYTFGNGSGAITVTPWGDAVTDIPTPGDFDGDGKDDVAIWRNGGPGSAGFYIFQSSNNTLRFVAYGETIMDPTVVADYDGDGKDDPAGFGCPTVTPGPCYFTYMGSFNNPSGNVTYVPWGVGVLGDLVPDPGDYDGDGKADFCVQRADPINPAQAQFALLKSNGFGVEFVSWGLTSDFVLPGDYDGDGKADFMVARYSGGTLQHFLFTRTGTVRLANWGITGDDPVPGDYDGDGKTDLAVWRPSATPGQSTFYVYRSTDATVQIVPWGQCAANPCDQPAADWQVH